VNWESTHEKLCVAMSESWLPLMLNRNLKLTCTAKTQQHPFHVLSLSTKLLMVMAALSGGLAISIVMKLQNVSNPFDFLFVGYLITYPLFDFLEPFAALGIPHDDFTDIAIMQFLALILLTLWS